MKDITEQWMDKCFSLRKENRQLKEQIKNLQDINKALGKELAKESKKNTVIAS